MTSDDVIVSGGEKARKEKKGDCNWRKGKQNSKDDFTGTDYYFNSNISGFNFFYLQLHVERHNSKCE